MNRERFLYCKPDGECDRQCDGENQRADLKRHTQAVGQIIRDQRAEDTDQHDSQPINGGDVSVCLELEEQHCQQNDSHCDGSAGQANAQIHIQEIRCGLTDGGAQDFYYPEIDRYFGDFA